MAKCYLLIFVLFTVSVMAQKDKKNNFKISTLTLIEGVYELNYERVLNHKISFQTGLGYGHTNIYNLDDFQELYFEFFEDNLNNPTNTHHSKQIFTAHIDFRYFVENHQAPKGFYFGPSFQYINFKERFFAHESPPNNLDNNIYEERLIQRHLKLYNFGVLFGYQFLISKVLCLNPYAGPSLVFGNTDPTFQKTDENTTGFGLSFGILMGIAF